MTPRATDPFIVHWLCGGRLAWIPDDWPLLLACAVWQQACADLVEQAPWWCVPTQVGVVQGSLN